ncbi:hypothetical protein [Comamonas thiooxydans]|uniref:hypothetical protein n=1 Tax=Comamonas thiooxydans TaxID=363952 RepID=UPI000B41FFCD|nr:hypothetical protein [Comamonas thiooxydans]
MRKLFVSAIMAATTMIGGCAADAAFYAFKAVDAASSTQFQVANKDGVDLDFELEKAWAMPFVKREIGFTSKNKCQYSGVLVPWDRTWEIVQNMGDSGTQQVTPPNPGVMAGHAALIYERKCQGQPTEAMMFAGEMPTGRAYLGRKFNGAPFVPWHHNASTQDMFQYTEDQRPLWFQQVVDRLIRLSPTSPDAKKAVAESKDILIKLYPEKAAAIEVALK